MSIFFEGCDPEDIESCTKFHEPEYVHVGDDGEFEQKKDTIPGTVPAAKPIDKVNTSLGAVGEFSSIFLSEEAEDTDAKKQQKEAEQAAKKAEQQSKQQSNNSGSGSQQECKESTFLDSIELI